MYTLAAALVADSSGSRSALAAALAIATGAAAVPDAADVADSCCFHSAFAFGLAIALPLGLAILPGRATTAAVVPAVAAGRSSWVAASQPRIDDDSSWLTWEEYVLSSLKATTMQNFQENAGTEEGEN